MRIIGFVLLFISQFLTAQIVQVIDSSDGDPLEFATISNAAETRFITTNRKGEAIVDVFGHETTLEFRLLGYQTKSIPFNELSQDYNIVELDPVAVSLDQVLVSATRWKQSTRDLPYRIVSVHPDDVLEQNTQTMADLLGGSGEVFIQKSQQGGGSPMIRGFSANRLLYAVDGVRMNTAIFRSGNLQNVISLDAFAMEDMEVLFGPGSVTYGSDAIGGVMTFQTITPQLSHADEKLIKGKTATRFSSANNEQTYHGDIMVGGKQWSFVSSATYSSFGNLGMGSLGPDSYLNSFSVTRIEDQDIILQNPNPEVQLNTAYNQLNLMQKLRYSPGRYWDLQYGLHYSTTSEFGRYDRLIELRDDQPRHAVWNYGPQVWSMNHFEISHFRNTNLYDQMVVRAAWQQFRESRIDRRLYSDILREREESVGAGSVTVDLSKSLGKQKLFYGFEVVLNKVVSEGFSTNIVSEERSKIASRYPDAWWHSYAAYLNWQYRLSSKLMLQSGLRLSQFLLFADFTDNLPYFPFQEKKTDLHFPALNGSLGVSWFLSDYAAFRANISSGFRAPNVDDVGKVFDSEPGAVVIPNPNLAAEYAWNAEIGFSQILMDQVKFEITAYYTLLTGAMIRRDFTVNTQDSILYDGELSRVQAIQNAARADVYGGQARLEWTPLEWLSFDSQLNLQEGVEETDDGTLSPSRHTAPFFGRFTTKIKYNKFKGMLFTSFSGSASFEELSPEERAKPHIYATDENGNPWSPAWVTLNARVIYNPRQWISFNVGVENITDQRYRPYSSGLVAAGRNFVLSLHVSF